MLVSVTSERSSRIGAMGPLAAPLLPRIATPDGALVGLLEGRDHS